jgi:hypothetical protein
MIVFDNATLVPREWQPAEGSAIRCFNPALLRLADGWLLAYRVVVEPESKRRIGLCRLDEQFRIVPQSTMPFSDGVTFPDPARLAVQALSWFADPRLYRLGGRIFLYWNSGWHEPQNHQFLQELDERTLAPIGSAREMRMSVGRQKLEKNWSLFEHRDSLFAIYSVSPHRVLRFDLTGDGDIEFVELVPAVPNPGGYAQVHGGLRGGAPPQQVDGRYVSICHSIENEPAGYCYVAAAYAFAGQPPFAPIAMPLRPLPIAVAPAARRQLPKLNPAIDAVLYPCGAVHTNGTWYISLGVDDERCAIAAMADDELWRTLGSA